MSKLFIIVLLAVFLIPAAVFAAPSVCLPGGGNSTGGVCSSGNGMMTSVSGTCSNDNGNASYCGTDGSCGVNGRSCTGANSSSCGATGGDTGTCGSSYRGMMGGTGGDGSVSTTCNGEMSRVSLGQASAAGAGMYGWGVAGVLLVMVLIIVLIVVWIIVGILLIIWLNRKLSVK